MSYRDEGESWIARAHALESELEEVKAERDRLQDELHRCHGTPTRAYRVRHKYGLPPAFGPATEPLGALAWTTVLLLFALSLLAHWLR